MKDRPNKTGYWWAELENGRMKCLETVLKKGVTRVFHKDWRTPAQIEESFKVKAWRGEAVPPKAEG